MIYMCAFAAVASLAVASPMGKTVEIAPGVVMPSMNLGTCCGSEPKVGLAPYLAAGGTGIDTAWDYHDQTDIAEVLKSPDSPSRDKLFITTKVPAGFGNKTDCSPDPMIAFNYIKENIRELGVDFVDLALVHRPCQKEQTSDPVAANNALWKGMIMALQANLTRAIGVSNYRASDLKSLDMSVATPAVNQCLMSIDKHDDETIAFCQANDPPIVYEAYDAMKGCPSNNADVLAASKAHNASVYQICMRWVLERGAIMAVGTGADPSTVGEYAKENLAIYDFALTEEEMKKLNGI